MSQFTLQNVRPKLRAELDRRILASASLIKLNREATIAKTLQRFAGWASSVPKGGTDVADRPQIKKDVKRGLAGLPFEERRVLTDQGHKLIASINEIIATDGGAIAATWRHVNEGYEYQARPEHVARDGKVYVIRDGWAKKDGRIKPIHGYTDEVEQPAELPFCRCRWVFIYSLGRLPTDMLTRKGQEALAEARAALKSA